MKILQIVPSLHMGGAEKFAVDLSNELSKDTSNSVFLCSILKIDENGILASQIAPEVSLLSLDKSIGFSFKTFIKLFEMIRKLKPDIIHTHLRALFYSAPSIIFLKIPVVHTIHNLAHQESATSILKIYNFLFKYFNVTPVSISNEVLKSTKKLYGTSFNENIDNGVKQLSVSENSDAVKLEIDNYKLNKNDKVFLNIGRVSKQKNQKMLIESVKELYETKKEFILLIIGSLENEREYSSECLELAKGCPYIHFIGLKSNVGDYMKYSDALCMSSIYEGLPLVVLEAMSIGKPLITTPAGGIPDVIEENVSGYISRDYTEKSFLNILHLYIKSPIDNSAKIIERYNDSYSINICMKNYSKLYYKLYQM